MESRMNRSQIWKNRENFMRKLIVGCLCTLACIGSASLFAENDLTVKHQDHSCSSEIKFRGGSFIAQRGNDVDTAILDQYEFNVGGTIYYNQSNALFNPITSGTFAPDIGTWQQRGEYVYSTTIGFQAIPDVNIPGDVVLNGYTRFTQKLKIISKDRLETVHRVVYFFDFDQDPLTDNGVLLLDSNARFYLNRVHVKTTDLE